MTRSGAKRLNREKARQLEGTSSILSIKLKPSVEGAVGPGKAEVLGGTVMSAKTAVPAKTVVPEKAVVPEKVTVPVKAEMPGKTVVPEKAEVPGKIGVPDKTVVPEEVVAPGEAGVLEGPVVSAKTAFPASKAPMPEKTVVSEKAAAPEKTDVPGKAVVSVKTTAPAKVAVPEKAAVLEKTSGFREASLPQKTAVPAKAAVAAKVVVPGAGEQTKVGKAAAVEHVHNRDTPDCVCFDVYHKRGFSYSGTWCPKCDAACITANLKKIIEVNYTYRNRFGRIYFVGTDGSETYDVTLNSDVEKLKELVLLKAELGGEISLRMVSTADFWLPLALLALLTAATATLFFVLSESDRSKFITGVIGHLIARLVASEIGCFMGSESIICDYIYP